MRITINISDSLYDRLMDMNIDSDTCSFNESALVEAIQNGTPLDKIRAEIIDLSEGWNGMQAKDVPLGAVLKVIDKYREESEDK